MKPSILVLLPLYVVLLLTGCATQPEWARYELCFGLSADSGRTSISEQQWQQFRDNEIATRFPDGFTVCPGTGYWKTKGVTYSEASEILMVVAPDTKDTQRKINEIAAAYSRRFIQESVLEIKSSITVDFHSSP